MQPIRQAGRSAGFAPALAYDDGLRAHMLRVYNYMGLGLLRHGLRCRGGGLGSGDLRADLLHARCSGW